MSQLTHINAAGEAHMVDVSAKAETVREARAEAYVEMRPETLAKAGIHCPSTPSRAMRVSVSTARGMRNRPMKASRCLAVATW